MLTDKQIVLGITGGIAAYKSCTIVRELVKRGADVHVIMTAAACHFVTPLTLETLSGHPVTTDLFGKQRSFGTHHIEIAQAPDAMLIAPATYNIIGKVASGIADDFLSTAITAATCPVFFAPAMNSFMFANPIQQRNLELLKQYYHFVMPGTGDLACGYTGQGRMAEPEVIVAALDAFFQTDPIWNGKRVLITAGPTREKIDPVRYLSNFSSGKMGFALAEAARNLGATVTLIAGPVSLATPTDVHRIDVVSADEMHRAVLDHLPDADVVIKAAAVADYRARTYTNRKIKKTADDTIHIELEKTPDILQSIQKHKRVDTRVIGFALETDDEIENALKKMHSKGLDMIVLNNPRVDGAGFQVDTNVVTILYPDGTRAALPLMDKKHVAVEILRHATKLLSDSD